MIKVKLYLTFTKVMALLVLALGSIYSFYAKDPDVMIFTLSIAGGLAGLKSWSSALITRHRVQRGGYRGSYYDDDQYFDTPNDENFEENDGKTKGNRADDSARL